MKASLETGLDDDDWELRAVWTSYDHVKLDPQSGVAGIEEFLSEYQAARAKIIAVGLIDESC